MYNIYKQHQLLGMERMYDCIQTMKQHRVVKKVNPE